MKETGHMIEMRIAAPEDPEPQSSLASYACNSFEMPVPL